VLTKVENAVKVEPVGEFELKGIRRPLAAYNVIGTGAKVKLATAASVSHRGKQSHPNLWWRGVLNAFRQTIQKSGRPF
jgi:hypothetical protein